MAGLKVEVEKKVCTDADLDAELERLQRTRTEWSEVDSDEVVAETHRVRVKFTATLEDEVLAEDQVQTFTLDDVSLEPDIKAALIGKKVGEPFEASITFSEDNPNEKLRGQAVAHRFELELIEEGELPALDDELAKAVGLEDFENLKEQVKASLEYRFEQGYQTEMEEKVLDQLIENNPLEVPTRPRQFPISTEWFVRHFRGFLPNDMTRSVWIWKNCGKKPDRVRSELFRQDSCLRRLPRRKSWSQHLRI